MRLLWVSNRGDLGGAELALSEGVDALAARGHEIHVILPRAGPLAERLTSAASVEISPHNPWGAERVKPTTAMRWLAYDVRVAAPAIAQHARHIGAEMILSNTVVGFAGAVASRRADLPHAWFLHEFGSEDHGIRFFLGARASFRVMRALGDAFIVNSEATARYFGERLPAERIHRVRYAVDIVGDPSEAGEHGADGLHLVLVGVKSPSKGQHDAIAAVGELVARGIGVDLELVGASMGPYESELMELARELGVSDNVRFVSFSDDPGRHLAAAHAALMCSRAEAFGRVTVEAMKLGTPVVGANAGATPELIRDGWSGLLYRAGDAGDLAERLAWLAAHPEAIGKMGRHAREWATRTFTAGEYGSGLEDALRAAVSRHQPSARKKTSRVNSVHSA